MAVFFRDSGGSVQQAQNALPHTVQGISAIRIGLSGSKRNNGL
jgi:hypothetical protein